MTPRLLLLLINNFILPGRPNLKAANTGTTARPRPQPIAGTPPPDPNEKCDTKIIQQTCNLFGLDLVSLPFEAYLKDSWNSVFFSFQERPPPVPPSRSYTVTGNSKLGYPQTRVMKMNYPEDNGSVEQLRKGDHVTVTGASHRRGHLIVEHNGLSLHVPYQYMELIKSADEPPAPTAAPLSI
jgi:dachs